ncbi:carbamoyl-phosphate synthase large subunit [Thermomicrobiaceae bacterium CFH 74404]|uniref:Carbamoyl phosphate synthase large chain n=1 Tax=Thermalbibacter longus TaxID=2951981 RepID=A0AA41WE80_9BACT|nr:carbamoyl-phosphate synthase large subunit [Thermalbibacter longus]MCM8748944.1 carbamoyl-phosphate synthase large subunit [Thermalbibacter longus]
MGSRANVSNVLVIGSGPIVIGQAAEFDYSGSQALRALREEGVRSILVNSNPATIMTDEDVADVVYIEPLTVEVLHRVIARERPDGLLPTLGGQTGLNLAVQLAEAGILDRYGVRVLGTPLDAIRKAEDRQLFKELLIEIGEPVVESVIAYSFEEARRFARQVPLPLIVRPAYTLGGTGGGVATTLEELEALVRSGINASPIGQVLVERSLLGWKEIEYEVMRDSNDTCITICNMENFDPMGVHTGDSIVVAPSQTLSDRDYQMLRSAALKIIRALGIEGGCNIQFALDPKSSQYYVIEVNPRVSRSSALASKATGYPIARVAAKIAVGRTLDELMNSVTGQTSAAFEPALDYCVVKIPRWPFDKFRQADRTLGSQMKATGEVMAIDRSFEAALQKAVRSLETDQRDLLWEDSAWDDPERLLESVRRPNDLRLWALAAALRRGYTPEELSELSGIDPWFTRKLRNIVALERRIAEEPLSDALLWEAKRAGFADHTMSALSGVPLEEIRHRRWQAGFVPVYKMVDTCAAEFEAATPYFYSTYEDEDEASPLPGPKAAVIGSGPIRIGQGIEFDYCSVKAAQALHEAGVAAIMLNNNPETVSTDFDASDRLYVEPLDEESVYEVLRHETRGQVPAALPPVILQFGGQTAINLAQPLARLGVPILGTSDEVIDIAEDRRRFERFLAELGIPQPPGAGVTSLREALEAAERIGYPVLARPSYVLGGRAMEVVHSPEYLERYLMTSGAFANGRPVLIDKYLEGKEVEVDAICDGREVLIPGVMEHIERAGVHSGDSFAVYPGVHLDPSEVDELVEYTTRIALALGAIGLINIQFVIHCGRIHVLEVNPRASRTVPFLSKVTGVPMVPVATNVLLGRSLREQGYEGGLWPRQPLVAVKAPVFSMSKLRGAEVYLGPEMKSTGEAMGIDRSFAPALYKALIAAGLALPPRCGVLVSLADQDKAAAMDIVETLVQMGHRIYATEGTATAIERQGLPVQMVPKRIGQGSPNVLDLILDGTVRAVINTPGRDDYTVQDGFKIRRAAVERGIPCITSLDTARAVVKAASLGGDTFTVQPLPLYRRAVPAPITG